MNYKIFLVFIFMSTSLFAEQEPAVIESAKAHYDGTLLILSGDARVQQNLGTVSAQHMVLTPESGKRSRFVHLNMQDDVKIELKDGGQLLCQKADLDYETAIGQFSGNAAQEYVIYTENCPGKRDKKFPILVKSRKMNIELTHDEKEHSSHISKVMAEQNVTLNYNHDFVASSEQAEYQRLEGEGGQEKLTGHIRLFSLNKENSCQITNKNGDLIRSSTIDVDTSKQKLQFSQPSGFLSIGQKCSGHEKMHFESDFLNWDNKQNTLLFNGNVSIRQKNYGDLQGSQEVKLLLRKEDGKKKIKQIESVGETVLAHIDENKNLMHTLTAYGKVLVDHLNHQTIIESPKGEDGLVLEGMQIYFHDILGEMYADHAVLDYKQVEGVMQADKLLLEGNVRILNRSSINPEESEAFLQYALADRVEFFLRQQEVLMSSFNADKRVLFYDKANSLQVSAPAVKIKRNALTKKESIQGIGDARFSLDGAELEKLKTHFSLEQVHGKFI